MLPLLFIGGFSYVRGVWDNVTPQELKALKKKTHYIYLVSYVKHVLPDFHLTGKKTAMIDLGQDLDTIFAGFKKNTRNEIRKTEHMPHLTFIVDDPNIAAAYEVYKKAKRKDGALLSLKREFEQSRLFSAYDNSRMIVTMACYDTDKILRLKSIASLRKENDVDPKVIGYASRRLIWEIIKFGKAHGYKSIDMGGVNFSEKEKVGIAQFKQSFGGTIVNEYTYRYRSLIFGIIRRLLPYAGREIF